MNIRNLKNLLEVFAANGIDEVIFDPLADENATLVRGASSDKTIIVFSKIDEVFDENKIAVQNVKALLSRFMLFDDDKATCHFTSSKGIVTEIDIKQGRKKVSYKCARPDAVSVPSVLPEGTVMENVITFDKAYTEYISKVASSMGMTGVKKERTISIKVENNEANVAIWDGEEDTFFDNVEAVGVNDTQKASWSLASFQKVMLQSVANSGAENVARFAITDFGIAIFDMSIIQIMVAPVAVS